MTKSRSFPFDFDGKKYVINITMVQSFGLFDVIYIVNVNKQNEKKIRERHFFDRSHRAEYITRMDGHWIIVDIIAPKKNISTKISVDGVCLHLHNQELFISPVPILKGIYIFLFLLNTIVPVYKFITLNININIRTIIIFCTLWFVCAVFIVDIVRSDSKIITKMMVLFFTMYFLYWLLLDDILKMLII